MFGILKGYVIINPRWAGFTENDYLAASASVYNDSEPNAYNEAMDDYITVSPGEFDMSGFQVTRGEFLNAHNSPTILISYNKIKFSMECLATNAATIQGESLEVAQMAATCDDVKECIDFSYDGFQVVRREFFAHIFEPSITFNNCKVGFNTAYQLGGNRY